MEADPTFKNDFQQASAAAGLEFSPPIAQTTHLADRESTHSLAKHEASLAMDCFCIIGTTTVDAQGTEGAYI